MLAKQVQTMAAYNRWMNDKLYAACADISVRLRVAETAMSFLFMCIPSSERNANAFARECEESATICSRSPLPQGPGPIPKSPAQGIFRGSCSR